MKENPHEIIKTLKNHFISSQEVVGLSIDGTVSPFFLDLRISLLSLSFNTSLSSSNELLKILPNPKDWFILVLAMLKNLMFVVFRKELSMLSWLLPCDRTDWNRSFGFKSYLSYFSSKILRVKVRVLLRKFIVSIGRSSSNHGTLLDTEFFIGLCSNWMSFSSQ